MPQQRDGKKRFESLIEQALRERRARRLRVEILEKEGASAVERDAAAVRLPYVDLLSHGERAGIVVHGHGDETVSLGGRVKERQAQVVERHDLLERPADRSQELLLGATVDDAVVNPQQCTVPVSAEVARRSIAWTDVSP